MTRTNTSHFLAGSVKDKLMNIKHAIIPIVVAAVALFAITTRHVFFRIDMTEDGRYSLSEPAYRQLKALSKPLTLRIYLNGDLDANMLRLKHSVLDMVEEMNEISSKPIEIVEIDPNDVSSDDERYVLFRQLEDRGIRGMNVSHRKRGGSISESIIFPWAELCSENDTMLIPLMQADVELSGEQAVNSSVEDVEFRLIDAVRILNRTDVKKVAFIEGHGELPERFTYDITVALSRYFQIDRGVIGNDASVLDSYAAIVIAKPTEPFSERDKFIIDQYIMNGGSVFWLVDGVCMSDSMLSSSGMTPLVVRDVNLTDQLFRYGVRITPTIVEDMQCAYMPVNLAAQGEKPRFEPIPWSFTPLLRLSPFHPVTKSLSDVKVDYASGIEIVGDTIGVTKEVLMVSSNASHVSSAPGEIDIMQAVKVEPSEYFTSSYVPVGVVMEGCFNSVFAHRSMPDSIVNAHPFRERSVATRMIVVGDGDVLRNEIQQTRNGLVYPLPVGLDRVSGYLHGNRDFAVNSLLFLTDDEGVMQLRSRHVGLRMLNRASAEQNFTHHAVVNVLLPLLLLALTGAIYNILKRLHYAGKIF